MLIEAKSLIHPHWLPAMSNIPECHISWCSCIDIRLKSCLFDDTTGLFKSTGEDNIRGETRGRTNVGKDCCVYNIKAARRRYFLLEATQMYAFLHAPQLPAVQRGSSTIVQCNTYTSPICSCADALQVTFRMFFVCLFVFWSFLFCFVFGLYHK